MYLSLNFILISYNLVSPNLVLFTARSPLFADCFVQVRCGNSVPLKLLNDGVAILRIVSVPKLCILRISSTVTMILSRLGACLRCRLSTYTLVPPLCML